MLNLIKKLFLKLFKKQKCFYINGPETLPPPLSKEEEQKIMDELQNGIEDNRELLIIHNLRLVVYIAKKFENKTTSTEDLVSIGTIGLMKAVKTFNPEKNIKLATYASRCIENEILMHLRKVNNIKSEMSFDEPLSVDWDGNELTLRDVLGTDPNDVFEEIEYDDEKRLLRQTVAALPEKERNLMTLRFGLDGNESLTQKQLADKMGISQSHSIKCKIIYYVKEDFFMTLYIKVGSITNAQRSQRSLRQNGYKSIIKKLENPSPQDGCGYMVVVNTYTEEPISILIKEGIQIRGVERE